MFALSSECRGARISDGPSASAARTSSRLVSDFEPGSETDARSGPSATGAGHSTLGSSAALSPYGSKSGAEYFEISIVVKIIRDRSRGRRRT